MSIYYNFYEAYDGIDSSINYFDWKGKYTVGMTGCRGTRVWFKYEGAESYIFHYNKLDLEYTEELREILRTNSDQHPCDDCVIHDEGLSEIIQYLENLVPNQYEYSKDTYHTLRLYEKKKLFEDEDHFYRDLFGREDINCSIEYLEELLVNVDPTQYVLLDICPIGNFLWSINDMEGITNELKEIFREAEEHTVTFHWI